MKQNEDDLGANKPSSEANKSSDPGLPEIGLRNPNSESKNETETHSDTHLKTQNAESETQDAEHRAPKVELRNPNNGFRLFQAEEGVYVPPTPPEPKRERPPKPVDLTKYDPVTGKARIPPPPHLWVKGRSGNPKTQKAKDERESLALLKEHTLEAAEILIHTMRESRSEKMKLECIKFLFDRVMGKPKQESEVKVTDPAKLIRPIIIRDAEEGNFSEIIDDSSSET